jgi:chromatin remodeling complex protein RSC6
LAAVVGQSPVTVREAMRLVWAHVAAYGLRDARNPHEIQCDAALRAVVGGERVGRLELPAHLTRELSADPW